MDTNKEYKIGGTVVLEPAYAATLALAPTKSRNIVKLALTGACTVNVDVSKSAPGDKLIFKVGSDATARDLTFGTGITGPVMAGTINKIKTQEFIFDGEAFIATGALVQID